MLECLRPIAEHNIKRTYWRQHMHTGLLCKWGITLASPLVTMLFLQYSSLSFAAILFFAVTICIAFVWGFDLLPATMAAISLCVLYILLGIAKPATVFSSWGSTVPWITVGGLFFAEIVQQTGLAKRIALRCILLVGCSMTRLFIGMALAGVVLALLVPSITARVVMFIAIGVAFCQSLELNKNSKTASAIILMAYAAGAHTIQAIFTAANVSIILVEQLQKAGFAITFVDYFIHNIAISIPYTIISVVMCRWLLGNDATLQPQRLQNMIEARMSELGPMTKDEVKALILLLFGMTIFATEHLHKLPGAYVFLAASLVGFLPGINLLNEKSFGKINFSVVVFIASCMGIGSVAKVVGADTWIASQLLPLVQDGSALFVTMCAYSFGVIINFMLTPLAAIASLGIPLIEMAKQMNIPAPGILYSFIYGLDQYIFPYEYAPLLYAFSCGFISLKHVMGALAMRIIIVAALLAGVGYPVWSYFGVV